MRLPALLLALLAACTCGDPAPAAPLDAGAPRACEGPVSLVDVDVSDLVLDTPGSFGWVRAISAAGPGAIVLHDLGSHDTMGLGAVSDFEAPRYEPWARVPVAWGWRVFPAARGRAALLVTNADDERLRWLEVSPEGPLGPGVALDLEAALGGFRGARACGPGRFVAMGCAPDSSEGRFALVGVDTSGVRTSSVRSVAAAAACGDTFLPNPVLRACAEHAGRTSALITGFATADDREHVAGVLTWDEAGDTLGEAPVVFGDSDPRDPVGAVALVDGDGPLFVLFEGGEVPRAHAYRVEGGEARAVGSQLLRPFGDVLALGPARLSERRSLLVYRQGSFLSALAFEAGRGFGAPVLITNEVGTNARFPPLETRAGVFVPLLALDTWLQLCGPEAT
ncbi:MAG: hypothetical protein AAGH15_17145 [Myxococcota bacterium]